MAFLQNSKFVNLLIRGFVFLCHEQVNDALKVALFQKVQWGCQISKEIFQNTILNLKLEFPAHNGKQLVQASGLELISKELIHFGGIIFLRLGTGDT